tara:strand:- start:43 stop:486 length:444 start_codon:yes stop_codon:yes gene_type:complete
MNELSQIIFSVLFGLLGLYVIVFWGMGIASLVRSYVHDGEKDYKSFYTSVKWSKLLFIDCMDSYTDNKLVRSVCPSEVAFFAGVIYPALTAFALSVLHVITKAGDGPILLTILGFVAGIWVILRVMRTVVRLSKRLVAHEKNSEAHK